MNTRFSSLVKIKKSEMQKKERLVQNANADLNSALMALELSRNAIYDIQAPKEGFMSGFLQTRTLLDSSRHLIEHNQEWAQFAQQQVFAAKEELKKSMIEYEKFNYLELQEIKKMLQKQKVEEAKMLDEVALMAHQRKNQQEVNK
jgi:flagellar biosynthesis chaperone FliJ